MALRDIQCSESFRCSHDYQSVQGRPIKVFSFGSGKRTLLVMGGVHGDERNGVDLAYSILEKLVNCEQSRLRNRIIVMPLINPDGYEAGTRENARKIDLNRNFPTKDFEGTPESSGGVEPSSEPETKAVLDAISYYKPELIISLHASMACVNYNGTRAVETAEKMSAVCDLPAVDDVGYPCPGSMGTYYGLERELPVITLELPAEGEDVSMIEQAVMETIGARSPKSAG